MTDALEVLAGLRLEDGRPWGEAAASFQWADARAVLSGDYRLSYLTRPRGASKTSDLAGIALSALIDQLPRESRSYGIAVDRDQGRLLIDSVLGFVARTPGLAGAVKVDRWTVTNARNGATFEVLAADAPGAWGLRPHFMVIDEFAQWPTTTGHTHLWSALFSALPKVPTSRLVILTSAGDPASPSYKLLERARADQAWYVSEVPGPTPWISAADLEQQRAGMSESEYARLHLNVWTAPEDRLTSIDALRECVTLDGPLRPERGTKYVVGVDLGLKNDRTVCAIVHGEPIDSLGRRSASTGDLALDLDAYRYGVGSSVVNLDVARPARRTVRWGETPEPERRGVRVVLDRMMTWQGTRRDPVRLSDVEAWITQAHGLYNRATVALDPWQAVGLGQRLRDRGVDVEEFTFSSASVARLASVLHLLLRDRALALPDDEELLDELANVRLRETSPGVLRMDTAPGQHDDRAIALALAAQEILSHPPVRAMSQVKYESHALRGTR